MRAAFRSHDNSAFPTRAAAPLRCAPAAVAARRMHDRSTRLIRSRGRAPGLGTRRDRRARPDRCSAPRSTPDSAATGAPAPPPAPASSWIRRRHWRTCVPGCACATCSKAAACGCRRCWSKTSKPVSCCWRTWAARPWPRSSTTTMPMPTSMRPSASCCGCRRSRRRRAWASSARRCCNAMPDCSRNGSCAATWASNSTAATPNVCNWCSAG